jgi:hypothetical protein
MRIAALGVLSVALLTRAEAGIAENHLQKASGDKKARKTSSAKDRPDAARASWEGIVRAVKMAQEYRTDRKAAVRAPRP